MKIASDEFIKLISPSLSFSSASLTLSFLSQIQQHVEMKGDSSFFRRAMKDAQTVRSEWWGEKNEIVAKQLGVLVLNREFHKINLHQYFKIFHLF